MSRDLRTGKLGQAAQTPERRVGHVEEPQAYRRLARAASVCTVAGKMQEYIGNQGQVSALLQGAWRHRETVERVCTVARTHREAQGTVAPSVHLLSLS